MFINNPLTFTQATEPVVQKQQTTPLKPSQNPHEKVNKSGFAADQLLGTVTSGLSAKMSLTQPAASQTIVELSTKMQALDQQLITAQAKVSHYAGAIDKYQNYINSPGSRQHHNYVQTNYLPKAQSKYAEAQTEIKMLTDSKKVYQESLEDAASHNQTSSRLAGTVALVGAGLSGYLSYKAFDEGKTLAGVGNAVATVGNLMLATSAFTNKLPEVLKKPAVVMAIGGSVLGFVANFKDSEIKAVLGQKSQLIK